MTYNTEKLLLSDRYLLAVCLMMFYRYEPIDEFSIRNNFTQFNINNILFSLKHNNLATFDSGFIELTQDTKIAIAQLIAKQI